MRSQLMLMMAAAAAFFSFPHSAHATTVVRGTGVYRSAHDCLKVLPAYTRKLESLGLKPTKPLDCEEVQGELEAYAPAFEAVADHNVVAETAVAAPLQDEQSCRESLHALMGVVADENETIVEASCVPISTADQEQDEMVTGQFQPMVILLKSKR